MNANRRRDQPGKIEHSPRIDCPLRIDRSLKPLNAVMSRFVSLVFVAGLLGAFAPGRAQAQSSIPREETWVTNGAVYAIAPTADTVYIGGSFTHVGPLTGCGTPLDVSTGQVQTPFPKVNGTVWACAADGAGGWFIGGSFGRVGNLERNGVAHILSDGSVDPIWNPNAGGTYPPVRALAVSGSTVYVGGNFTIIGGQPRNRLAALDAATGNATIWNPNASAGVYDAYVSALAVSGSIIYVGGYFTTIGGQSRNHIAALDAGTGTATAWNPNVGAIYAAVYTLAISGSTVYAGGWFQNIGGQPRENIAALDAATGNATAWNPNAGGGAVGALAVSGSTVYAGGWFNGIGGQTRWYIAALDATTGKATPWAPSASGPVSALAVSGSRVYAGGEFQTIGGQSRNHIAALDAATGEATSWNPNAGGNVYAIGVSDSAVYAGGGFASIGGQPRNNIAALDAATGEATAWDPNTGLAPAVYTLAISGSTVYAGGWFQNIGGQPRENIAALDAATGNATPWNPNAGGGAVRALAVAGSTIYLGGRFTTIGGEPRNNIAALDATTGNATIWNPNASASLYDAHVSTLAMAGSTIYVGGHFMSIGGQSRYNIAALDATTGNATPWDPDASNEVKTLSVSGSTVYAGGAFTSIGGQPRNNIAALDAATGNATAWNPNAWGGVYIPDYPPPWVSALAVSRSTVYVGGEFTSVGGQSRKYIAALDVATGNATYWNPNADCNYRPGAYAFAVSGSTVYAGGDFTTIGGEPRPYFAQFDGPPPTATDKWWLY